MCIVTLFVLSGIVCLGSGVLLNDLRVRMFVSEPVCSSSVSELSFGASVAQLACRELCFRYSFQHVCFNTDLPELLFENLRFLHCVS